MSKVGEYLKKIRLNQNLSLNDVYEKTGITDSRLNRIELEKNEPSPNILKQLSKLYNIDLINLYLMAGYLDNTNISNREIPFYNFEILDDEEKEYIQQTIDFFIKRK